MILKAGLVGCSIKQSLSPWIYQQFAKQFNVTIDYQLIEPSAEGFVEAVKSFRELGAQGVTITAPFKREAFQMADECSEAAKSARSANILLFKNNKFIYADNSDGEGLLKDIIKNHRYVIKGKRVLMLGAGGAVQGVLLPLLNENPREVVLVNRTVKKAEVLQQRFSRFGCVASYEYSQLANQTFDLIIDGTSCVDNRLPLPDSLQLSADSFCYDMKYSKNESLFLQWAKKSGAKKRANGLGMLIEQAVKPFYLWSGEGADTEPVLTIIAQRFPRGLPRGFLGWESLKTEGFQVFYQYGA